MIKLFTLRLFSVLILTVGFSGSLTAYAQQNQMLGFFTQRMEQARDQNDWPAMERACRDSIAAGFTNEYLLRSLSWGLGKQAKHEEAFAVATENWKLNPCAMSLIQYVEAAASGNYDEARNAAEHLIRNKNDWGNAASAAQNAITAISCNTYRFVWTIDPTKDCHQKQNAPSLRVPLPWTDMPYQTAEWWVSGAKSFEIEDIGENQCVRVIPNEIRPFQLNARIRLVPYNFSQQINTATEEKYPESVKPFLGQTGGADPTSAHVQSLAKQLRGKTRKESIENVLLWCNQNLRFSERQVNSVVVPAMKFWSVAVGIVKA